MKRLYRNLSDETKEKISKSMKNFHNNVKNTEQARQTSKKLSSSLKNYWDRVPTRSEYDNSNHVTMKDFLYGVSQDK